MAVKLIRLILGDADIIIFIKAGGVQNIFFVLVRLPYLLGKTSEHQNGLFTEKQNSKGNYLEVTYFLKLTSCTFILPLMRMMLYFGN